MVRTTDSLHKPVLLKESIDFLNVTSGTFVDCTLGGGGHSLEISFRLMDQGGELLSFDVDAKAIGRFKKLLIDQKWQQDKGQFIKGKVRIKLIQDNFVNLKKRLIKEGIEQVDGIIADLGVSSDQLEDSVRGFSYAKDSPLDMRMDKSLKVTAKDLVNGLYEKELIKIFRNSDEKHAKRIAREIVNERKIKPIKTTLHLRQIIQKALPFASKSVHRQTSLPSEKSGKDSLPCEQEGRLSNRTYIRSYWQKSAMRVFQSLRIAVNSELSSLQHLLPQAVETLAADKNLVVISFHSGEDRIVKNFFRKSEKKGEIEILTKRPVRSSADEVRDNLRARSARLRAVRKIKT